MQHTCPLLTCKRYPSHVDELAFVIADIIKGRLRHPADSFDCVQALGQVEWASSSPLSHEGETVPVDESLPFMVSGVPKDSEEPNSSRTCGRNYKAFHFDVLRYQLVLLYLILDSVLRLRLAFAEL